MYLSCFSILTWFGIITVPQKRLSHVFWCINVLSMQTEPVNETRLALQTWQWSAVWGTLRHTWSRQHFLMCELFRCWSDCVKARWQEQLRWFLTRFGVFLTCHPIKPTHLPVECVIFHHGYWRYCRRWICGALKWISNECFMTPII